MGKEELLALLQKGEKAHFFNLSPTEHQQVINELSAPNYGKPVGLALQVGTGRSDATLVFKFLDLEGDTIRKEVIDCHSMYSVHNAGYKSKSAKKMRRHAKLFLDGDFPATGREKNSPYFTMLLAQAHRVTGMDKFLAKIGGTEIVDSALKTACNYWDLQFPHVQVPGIPKIVSLKNNFHGRSIAAVALSSNPKTRKRFSLETPGFINDVPFDDIPALRKTFEEHRGEIAGLILEPIQGEGGIYVPHPDYHRFVRELCTEYGVLLIWDEIQTGMGRVGSKNPEHLFAYQDYGVKPDLVCIGKAAGGGVVPFSLLAGRKDVMDCATPDGATWSAHPLGALMFSCAVEVALREHLALQSCNKGWCFKSLLEKRICSAYPDVFKEIRGRGLFIGAEVNGSFATGREFSYALLLNGVWSKETGADGQTLRLTPPLTISYRQINACLTAIEKAIHLIENDKEKIVKALAYQESL